MMKSVVILFILILLNAGSASAWAGSETESRLSELKQKLLELEARIQTLESQSQLGHVSPRQSLKMQKPGSSSPWSRLKLGLNYNQVTELLGKPESKRKSAMAEYWYYSEKRSEGPYVKFIFSKVDGWKAP